MRKVMKTGICMLLSLLFVLSGILPWLPTGVATADESKPPNILVMMGDDIGWFNISAYNNGMMGYRTPSIDKLAKEGILFTDFYGEQSCTAGRAAFISGQATIRTGMTKVGLPGVPIALETADPTLADLLKPLGYRTGQFGKNHLGDLDKFLPTNHGFDEFYGNLYHLNAEEEPENEDYIPENIYPAFDAFRPRGVLHSYADGSSHKCETGKAWQEGPNIKDVTNIDKSDEDHYSYGQRVCDTGPLNKKRMETIDEEVLKQTKDFITEAKQADEPFFAWFNTTRMHVFTHLKEESQGVTGQGIEADGMVEHDQQIGELVQFIKDQGLEENTIIVYTTDNGAEVFGWPDGGMTPFRGEKNTNWEGGFRVPAIVSWKNHFPEGIVSNEIMSHLDWVPTLMAAVGVEDIQKQLLKDQDPGKQPAVFPEYEKYDVHLDGYNFFPYLQKAEVLADNPTLKKDCLPNQSVLPDYCPPRHEYIYFTDDGYPSAMRYDDWKLVFTEQREEGFNVWEEPYVSLRVPKLFNLRRDPLEKADIESDNYVDWRFRRIFLLGPIQLYLANLLNTFVAYPPRQKPASFSINQTVDGVVREIKIDRLQEEFPFITGLRKIIETIQEPRSD